MTTNFVRLVFKKSAQVSGYSLINVCFASQLEKCPFDYLEVFDGDTIDIKKRVAKLCGSDLPDPIESSGNTLILKFSSDYATGYKGFKLQLTKTGVALASFVSTYQE